ncbi:tetratricopeptide repeat protein [bacterium]|nr:tetratricopeptide repeat protein [bacterium]
MKRSTISTGERTAIMQSLHNFSRCIMQFLHIPTRNIMQFLHILPLVLLFFPACGPLIELEDENIALKSRIDSLEIALAECGTQTDLAHERLSAIESENLQLDNRNRQLAARVAELQYQQGSDASTQLSSGSPQAQATAGKQRPVSGRDAAVANNQGSNIPSTAQSGSTESTPPTSRRAQPSGAPDYRADVHPELPFLREYQAGLSAFNAGQFDAARRAFAGLLQTSRGNEMTDNCVYWLGETARSQKQLSEAFDLFSTVLGYRNSDKTAQALSARARTAIELGRTDVARSDCERLLKEFPKSDQAVLARQMLKKL